MAVNNLDRTPVGLDEAVGYIGSALSEQSGAEPARSMAASGAGGHYGACRAPVWAGMPESEARARAELLVALRDGDVQAKGRYSDTPVAPWEEPHPGRRWMLHSGHYSAIPPEAWRSGALNGTAGALTLIDGQFIDIKVPRFMLRAIWPPAPLREAPGEPPDAGHYSTPYLDLLHRAIAVNGITADCQPKKEILIEWFREQVVEGEPLSANLASAMATLVRLPSSQKGGNRKWTSG